MAKLVLTIQPKDEGALKSVQALKAEVQSLSKSLSSIKVTSSGVETTRKGYANLITTLKTLKSQYADGVFGRLPKDAERSFRRIQKISAAFQKNKTLTEGQAKAYANLSQKLKKLSADLATVKAKNDKIVAANPFTVTQAQQIPRLIKQYSTLLNHIKSIEKYYPKGTFDTFKADLTEGTTQLQGLNQEYQTTQTLTQGSQENLNNLANGFLQVNAAVAQTTSTMKSSKGSLIDIVAGFAKFQLSAMLVMKPLQMIRSALTSINETLVKTEDAVIALQRVLPSGSATDNEISSRLYKVAQDYGQTFENVSQIATNFARTGMSWAGTIKATEAAVLALNVAELDATEASKGLISILTQFEMKANDLETVVDKLNKAADKNPVTTEKLLTALQRTGAAAKNANITLDETIGIITTLSKATNRSGENLGTAVNSLIQFSSKESSLDTFAKFGGDVETAVEKFRAGAGSILEIWEELGEVIQNRQGEAESILGGGLFNDEDWAQLNDELKESLGESYADVTEIYNTASVFRRNYFVALLNDMDNVKKVTGEISDAAGYSQKENEKYLDTYTAKLNSLKAQWEELANSEQGLLGVKKFFVDVGSALLTVMKYTGGLTTAFSALGTAVMVFFGPKIVEKIASFNKKLSLGTLSLRKNTGELIAAQLNAANANDRLVLAQQALNTARQTGVGVTEAQKAVTEAETAVIQANTAARQAASTAIAGWISAAMLAITVVSAVVGAVRQAREEQERLKEERRQAALSEEPDELYGYAQRLEELRAEQEKGKDVSAELAQVQKELSDKYKGVKEAIEGTNDALRNNIDLTSEAARQEKIKEEYAWQAENDEAIKEAKRAVEGVTETKSREKNKEEHLYLSQEEYRSLWEGLEKSGLSPFAEQYYEGGTSTFKEIYLNFKFKGTAEEKIKQIQDLYRDVSEHGLEYGFTEEQVGYVQELLSDALNKVNTEAYQEYKEIYDRVARDQKLFEGGSLAEFYGIVVDVTEEIEVWHNNIEKVTDKYDTLIDKLKELRDAEKESLELEERKQAVLEAQKALEQARNEATVRRFNEETQQWEWQVDEKKVAEAEKDLEEARKELEEQAYDTIVDMLENKTATNEGLNNLLDWLKSFLGADFLQNIKQAILSSTNVNLNNPVVNMQAGGSSSSSSGTPQETPAAPSAGIQILKNADGSYAQGWNISVDKYGNNGSVTWNGKKYRIENGGINTDEELTKIVDDLIAKGELPDRAVFTYKGNIYSHLDGRIVKLQERANSYGPNSSKGYKAFSDDVWDAFGSYDSGGVANGMGFMPKATDRPETVNNPDLTEKILSPVSNAEFHRWVHDMGVLFETSRQYASAPSVEQVGGNTDNSVNNSGQIIMNGVTIGSDRRASTLDETLSIAGIVPNV